MIKALIPAMGLVLMGSGGYLAADLHPIVNPRGTDMAGLQAHETHASASLLGQFRTSVSSWLWLRTDLYLHNGVEMRPMTDGERNSGIASEEAAEDGHKRLMDESSVLTIIPSKERDFRGIFGDIERATNAYKDMHNHTHNDPIAATPLFRLMTWIDPSFIPGWVTGGSVIARDPSKAGALLALNYLNQGLEENPQSVAILMEISELQITRMHNLSKAVSYLHRARQIGLHRENILDEIEKDSLEQCYRWLVLCYRDLGKLKLMRTVAKEGLKLYPDDVIMMKAIAPPPMIFTPDYQRVWMEAKSAKEIGRKPLVEVDFD